VPPTFSHSEGTERRSATRHPIRRRVYFSATLQRPCLGVTADLSAGGAFVESQSPLVDPGELVTVFFVFDLGRVTRLRRLRARVVHASARGIGLSFRPSRWENMDAPARATSRRSRGRLDA